MKKKLLFFVFISAFSSEDKVFCNKETCAKRLEYLQNRKLNHKKDEQARKNDRDYKNFDLGDLTANRKIATALLLRLE